MKFATARTNLLLLAFSLCAAASVLAADDAFRSAEGGVMIKDLQMGQGPGAVAGQVATMHFIGWIDEKGARGREIYKSHAQGRPVSFVIGDDGVMQGWNEGVLGMRPGGARMLLVPPGMAYGQRQVDEAIPANASLMFRIELIALEDAPAH